MIYLGPYVASSDPSAPGWALPPGAVAGLNLGRQGQTPVGLFSGAVTDAEYVAIDPSALLTGRERAAWVSQVGAVPTGLTGAEAAWHAMTDGADAHGVAGPRPLVPTTGRVLRLSLPGALSIQRRWTGTDDPHLPKLRELLRVDLNAARGLARAGEMRDENGQVDLEAHRRLLRWHGRKLGLPDAAIVPPEWGADETGIDPRTTVSDFFTRADETPIASPWTGRAGTVYLQGNMARTITTGVGNFAQHTSAVSGTDHFCQYTIAASNGLVSHATAALIGPVARHTGTATENAYHVRMRLSDGLTQLYSISGGSFTAILNTTGPSWATSDVIQLECNGSDIGIKQNGSYVLSTPVSDSAISSGNYGGLRGFGPNGLVDDWSLEDLGGGGGAVIAAYYRHSTVTIVGGAV